MIPKKFRQDPPIQVNYSFVDMLANVGYMELYGVIDETPSYYFQRLALDSSARWVIYQPTGTGLQGETNFDYEFLTSQPVKGNLFLTLTYFARASATQTADCYLKIRIIHYDGSTETVIGTQQTTDTITVTTDSVYSYHRTTLTFAVNKQFNKGDKLRVEIEVYSGYATDCQAGFYCDGANKNWGQIEGETGGSGPSIGSNIIIEVPFDMEGML